MVLDNCVYEFSNLVILLFGNRKSLVHSFFCRGFCMLAALHDWILNDINEMVEILVLNFPTANI